MPTTFHGKCFRARCNVHKFNLSLKKRFILTFLIDQSINHPSNVLDALLTSSVARLNFLNNVSYQLSRDGRWIHHRILFLKSIPSIQNQQVTKCILRLWFVCMKNISNFPFHHFDMSLTFHSMAIRFRHSEKLNCLLRLLSSGWRINVCFEDVVHHLSQCVSSLRFVKNQ